ncbi:MAG: hypothetical protein F9K20_12425 [Hyphomicrobium sp.]|nr:MAG: hypothetical protein F9K20_12425 [Hyphomicrobium sp.]
MISGAAADLRQLRRRIRRSSVIPRPGSGAVDALKSRLRRALNSLPSRLKGAMECRMRLVAAAGQ